MERIVALGFLGIVLVLCVGLAFIVGALRNLVTAVLMLKARPEEMSPETEELVHSLTGLAMLHNMGMLSDEEYEKRKASLMEER